MAEKEYIERKALVEEIREAQRRLESCDDIKWERNKPYFKGLAWAHRIALDAPAADVVPRTEVAREIFEELFRYIYKGADIYCIAQEHLLSVEKKYTEGKE